MIGLLLSVEHATNQIPAKYRALFRSTDAERALASHRGYDLGSLQLAKRLSKHTGATLIAARASRLLVDLNRSEGHRALWSEFSSCLDSVSKNDVLDTLYRPHRLAVEKAIQKLLSSGRPVLHLGMHSFTPKLHGEVRNADVGLLYDPRHSNETSLAEHFRDELLRREPSLRVRRNYPYRGKDDGLTTTLRRHFGGRYLGIELELNQALLGDDERLDKKLVTHLAQTLTAVLQAAPSGRRRR
jgi:predicted N-formylglutamate amidohydrolase